MLETGPGARATIAFAGQVVRRNRRGDYEVRLDNDHLVIAHPLHAAEGAISARPAMGDRVRIEMAEDEMRGWRLARRP